MFNSNVLNVSCVIQYCPCKLDRVDIKAASCYTILINSVQSKMYQ